MDRLRLALVALVLAALAVLLPSPALAASEDVVDRLDIAIDIRPDGTLEVTETYHWDFGTRQGLGLTRMLDARFDYPHERDTVRVYRYRDFAVTSPSGAPAGVWPRNDGPRVRVDIGAPDGSSDRRSGVQVYELSYTVDGALNAIRGQQGVADQDELYWNATGHDWEVPIRQASVTVTGPAGVVDHACYQGHRGSTDGCDTVEADGGRVTATGSDLAPGSGLTIMAAYPPGTFDRVGPILEDEPTSPFSAEDFEHGRGRRLHLAPLAVADGTGRGRRGPVLRLAGAPRPRPPLRAAAAWHPAPAGQHAGSGEAA